MNEELDSESDIECVELEAEGGEAQKKHHHETANTHNQSNLPDIFNSLKTYSGKYKNINVTKFIHKY